MSELSKILITHRKEAGLTQAHLARISGVGKTVIWELEHGKESVQWDTLRKVLRVLDVTVAWQSPILERERAQSPAPPPTEASAVTPESSSFTPWSSSEPFVPPLSFDS
jgi:transcriptional regulator with XRE-family HTH domain